MKQRVFYTEAAYGLGLMILALGTALMEAADFGVSMVVAPAYLVYLKLSQCLPFFTFGMAEYGLQALLLGAMMLILRRFRAAYLFSFVTALLYGLMLDGAMALMALFSPAAGLWRFGLYGAGVLCCALGVSLFFHTYIPPEVYELFVKELSQKYRWDINKCKTCYDCISCLAGVLLSFAFFGLGHFEGVKAGTILCALVNGHLIGFFSRGMEKRFAFRDGLRPPEGRRAPR